MALERGAEGKIELDALFLRVFRAVDGVAPVEAEGHAGNEYAQPAARIHVQAATEWVLVDPHVAGFGEGGEVKIVKNIGHVFDAAVGE